MHVADGVFLRLMTFEIQEDRPEAWRSPLTRLYSRSVFFVLHNCCESLSLRYIDVVQGIGLVTLPSTCSCVCFRVYFPLLIFHWAPVIILAVCYVSRTRRGDNVQHSRFVLGRSLHARVNQHTHKRRGVGSVLLRCCRISFTDNWVTAWMGVITG